MAVTNEQVLNEISLYRTVNNRPCPANYLTAKFGEEVLDVIASLKKAGTLIGKRGRTGGLVTNDETPVQETQDASSEETSSDDIAEQFAALAAKLAAADESNAVAAG